MKKRIVLTVCILAIFLGGCSGTETFEVISDGINEPNTPMPAQIKLEISEDVAVKVMHGEGWELYEGDRCQIIVQTYPSGNLDETLKQITGYGKECLTVMELREKNMEKYVFAWSVVSGEGELVGRCTVLDDGWYHYCLTVLTDAECFGELRDTVDAMFATYSLEVY